MLGLLPACTSVVCWPAFRASITQAVRKGTKLIAIYIMCRSCQQEARTRQALTQPPGSLAPLGQGPPPTANTGSTRAGVLGAAMCAFMRVRVCPQALHFISVTHLPPASPPTTPSNLYMRSWHHYITPHPLLAPSWLQVQGTHTCCFVSGERGLPSASAQVTASATLSPYSSKT